MNEFTRMIPDNNPNSYLSWVSQCTPITANLDKNYVRFALTDLRSSGSMLKVFNESIQFIPIEGPSDIREFSSQ